MIYELIHEPKSSGTKAMFVVPKKKFRDANDRNKLKRRMREAYRLCKNDFYKFCGPDKQYLIGFVFYSSKPETYEVISKAFRKLLTSLMK